MVSEVFLILMSATMAVFSSCDNTKPNENSQVDVRAVFINCEPDDREGIPADNAATRFEREELFKHSVLQDCNKKIALTVKITSEPEKSSGDEYIPVEHVFRGPNKRVRLLDPYVLRLHRETPLQAYKLRRLATVFGVLSNADHDLLQRESKDIEEKSQTHTIKKSQKLDLSAITRNKRNDQDCDLTESNGSNSNVQLIIRGKRHEHNIVVDDTEIEKYPRLVSNNDRFIQDYNKNRNNRDNFYETENQHRNLDLKSRSSSKLDEVNHQKHLRRLDSLRSYPNEQDAMKSRITEPHNWFVEDKHVSNNEQRRESSTKDSYRKEKQATENEFEMYEIENPDLLYTVQVQLFEKLTTPEGKTVWNDMTKGEPASVSTFSPEWIGQDMNIRYRPTEWIPREEFTLPLTSLCFLTPYPNSRIKIAEVENIETRDSNKKYIVVPKEDVLELDNVNNYVQKRDGNASNPQYSTEQDEQCRRRVLIRTSRAIFGNKDNKINIAMNGGDQFLTMPHHRPHHAQIDLEARADENQLVPIGSYGRIMTVVSDSSRRTRTTLTIQATNTGLAAAKFRAVVRECGPESLDLQNYNNGEIISDNPILLPPKHTRNIRLDVPTEMRADVMHCFVSLVNDDDESVAVKDVTIKKGDRCFCVWHCECVCLTEDPKLLCRDMSEARQIAAGLTLRERVRHARSVCYNDVPSINILVTASGVLLTLLLFGLVKALLGLICRCIGFWGLHRIIQIPRKLDHYYESSLRDSNVVYDSDGWPVHPSTKDRSVQLISKPMEFILNIIFFVITPCIIIYDILKEIYYRCKKLEDTSWKPSDNDKDCFSSHDVQGNRRWRRRQRHQIRKWMTPEAESLSSNLWQDTFPEKTAVNNCLLPLLREEYCRGDNIPQQSCVDSEGDDTEYVLMQMQKSKESLARSQRKLNAEK